MNHAQFASAGIYALSTGIAGAAVYSFLDKDRASFLNSAVYLGEALLLGSTVLVGELLLLSLMGLYRAPFLWSAVGAHFLFLLHPPVRRHLRELLPGKKPLDLPSLVFVALILIFFFRNCYFLMDTDSVSMYLFTQKLWLSRGTSIFGDPGVSMVAFAPQFDAVPYGLGLALFGQETLFPQLVNWFGRLTALLLIYGYTAHRFNGYYGLAAAMLVLLDGFHFFYSGVNTSVVINGMLIAFVFAAAYNFWEARKQPNAFRLVLALVFAGQIMANKYHMAYVFIFLLGLGLVLQERLLDRLKEILRDKRQAGVLAGTAGIASLWYLKNFLATGLATFPFWAGRFGIFGWTPQMESAFAAFFRGVTPFEFLKYASYLFVWPGVAAAKYVWIAVFFLPFIFLVSVLRRVRDRKWFFELSYWLGLSALAMMGSCLASHQDPRYPRFLIGIFAFAAVFAIDAVLWNCLRIRRKFLAAVLVLLSALPNQHVMALAGGSLRIPTFQDNLDVIGNRIHTADAIEKFFFDPAAISKTLAEHGEKVEKAAWGVGASDHYPAFLLPVRPVVGLWLSSVVKWDSYEREDSIVRDLEDFGLEWIMLWSREGVEFLSLEDYAKRAVKLDRFPKIVSAPYDLVPELKAT
jgi:hypothetical protein